MSLKSRQILLYATVNVGIVVSCYWKYLQGEPAKLMIWAAAISFPILNTVVWIGFRLRQKRSFAEVVDEIFSNEHKLRAGWRLLIYLLFVVLFTLAEIFLAMALHLPQITRAGVTATSMLVQEGVGIIAAFAAAAIMGLLEARPFGGYGLPPSGAFGARFWQGVAWGIAMIAGIIFLIRAFGGFSFGELALRGRELWGYAALWVVVFICVGLFEEFLFRGYAQFTLATGIGFWPAATALSAAFGAIHIRNSGEDYVGALSVFVIGMFFCLTLRRTGNLWFAVGLHAAFDWGETFLFSVPDSGLIAPGHLLNSSFHGPVWLTGGTVGPEGSVMAFAVVALAAVLFVIVYPAKE
jgi:membrane protease YdiL (CAAX protease family)